MDQFLVEFLQPFKGSPELALIALFGLLFIVLTLFFKIVAFILHIIWKVFDYYYTPYLKRTNIDKYWEREGWKNIEITRYGFRYGARIKDMNKFLQQPKVQDQLNAAAKFFELQEKGYKIEADEFGVTSIQKPKKGKKHIEVKI